MKVKSCLYFLVGKKILSKQSSRRRNRPRHGWIYRMTAVKAGKPFCFGLNAQNVVSASGGLSEKQKTLGAFTPAPLCFVFRNRWFVWNQFAFFLWVVLVFTLRYCKNEPKPTPSYSFSWQLYGAASCVLVVLCIVGWRHDDGNNKMSGGFTWCSKEVKKVRVNKWQRVKTAIHKETILSVLTGDLGY